MQISWRMERRQIVGRWSDARKAPRYDARWMQAAGPDGSKPGAGSPVPEFTRLSPFGRGGWYGRSR